MEEAEIQFGFKGRCHRGPNRDLRSHRGARDYLVQPDLFVSFLSREERVENKFKRGKRRVVRKRKYR